jgi:malate dehydrogenase
MKSSPLVSELSLYDVVNTPGVAADLSHISSPAKVTGYLPKDDGMKNAFTGAEMVVIPAGIPRKWQLYRKMLQQRLTTNRQAWHDP